MTPQDKDHPLPVLTMSTRGQDGYTIATISGDLDIGCVPELREQLLTMLGRHATRIVIDLSGVTFCDASGLAVLVGAGRRAWLLGGTLRLAAPAPPVITVLRLTGLDLWFEIFPTVTAATSAHAADGRDQMPASQLDTGPVTEAGPATPDEDNVHEAVTALLAHADAWRDADPDRQLTRTLHALAHAHASTERADLIEAARSLLADLLRHPLTHSPEVAATATELRRLLAPATPDAAQAARTAG